MSTTSYTVSDVARMAGVTVRTLHHYDQIGLLEPSDRTDAGYRLYRDEDLRRLHQILLFRELGFGLEAIARLLDDPAFDRRRALEAQRELLGERVRKTAAVMRAVDNALDALKEGREMDATELFDGFEDFDAAEYREEARERWGDTEAFKESFRRTRSYTKDDWARIKAESEEIMAGLAEVMEAGEKPTGAAATELAEQHRRHISRWFYPCSHAMHAGLADMYTADGRFQAYFEERAEGLAAFAAEAIRSNAATHDA